VLHIIPTSANFDDAFCVRAIETLYKVHDQPLIVRKPQAVNTWEVDQAMAAALSGDAIIWGMKVPEILEYLAPAAIRSILDTKQICWWQILPGGARECRLVMSELQAGVFPAQTSIQFLARVASVKSWESLEQSMMRMITIAMKDGQCHRIPDLNYEFFQYTDKTGLAKDSFVVALNCLGFDARDELGRFLDIFPLRKTKSSGSKAI
jgi:hypothetical protein